MTQHWQLRLTQFAERDFFEMIQWTAKHFGKRQAGVYATTLRSAFKALISGPDQVGCRARLDIGSDILTLHVARKGRKGRHFIVFRTHKDTRTIEVLRILHDSMDMVHYLDIP